MTARPHLAILGAGPIGLEAALAADDDGLPFTLYERTSRVAPNVRDWSHVELFTPWSLNVSPRQRRRLEAAGREVPDGDDCPSASELVERVLEPIARQPAVAERLRLDTRVVAVGREGLLKHEAIGAPERAARRFRILVEEAGERRVERADVVLDCTGTWQRPNWFGDGGIPAPGEEEHAPSICRRIPDLAAEAASWTGKTVLLIGAGHSAQTAARSFARRAGELPGTRLLWALRRREPGWGRVDDDPLPARAALCDAAAELAAGASPAVEAIRGVVVERVRAAGDDGRLAVILRASDGSDERRQVEVDRVLSLVGSVGEHDLYRQLQVHQCYATEGPMKLAAALLGAGSEDCLEQTSHGVDALRSPEPGFFILGSKSYGRTNTFLLRIGWEQVAEVIEAVRPAGAGGGRS